MLFSKRERLPLPAEGPHNHSRSVPSGRKPDDAPSESTVRNLSPPALGSVRTRASRDYDVHSNIVPVVL